MLPFDFMLIRRHVKAVYLFTLSLLVYYVLSETGLDSDMLPKLVTHVLVSRHLCLYTESYISTAYILMLTLLAIIQQCAAVGVWLVLYNVLALWTVPGNGLTPEWNLRSSGMETWRVVKRRKGITTICSVMPHKTRDLVHFAAEAWIQSGTGLLPCCITLFNVLLTSGCHFGSRKNCQRIRLSCIFHFLSYF